MHHSLVEVVGYNVEKEGGRQILEGIFEIPQNTPKYMTMVIDRLRMPQVVKRKGLLPTTITTTEHIQGWKKKKEKTASVKTELTFSAFKAGSQDKQIAELDCLSREIPYSKGFSPSSYKKVTDFQLLKKEGVYEVEAMRTIQLFSAAFNMNNKKIGK